MSFYVTLPSDTKKGIPGQPQNNYTTFMNPPILLPSKYEVALTEFVYSNKFDADIGTATIKRTAMFSQDQRNITTSIKLPEDYTSHLLAFYLNARFKTEMYLDYRRECIALKNDMNLKSNIAKYYYNKYNEKKNHVIFNWKNGKYTILTNQSTLVNQMDTSITFKNHQIQFTRHKLQNPYNASEEEVFLVTCSNPLPVEKSKIEWENAGFTEIKSFFMHEKYSVYSIPNSQSEFDEVYNNFTPIFNDLGHTITIHSGNLNFADISQNVEYEFNGLISQVLNLINPMLITDELKSTVKGDVDSVNFEINYNIRRVNQFLIYTDIIEEQWYGGQKLQVLHTFNFSQQSSAIVDTPHYVNVNKSCINSINIRICDREGDPVKFRDIYSNVIVKLHFREAQ